MKYNTDVNCCVDEVGDTIQKLVRTLQIFERGKLTKHGFTISQCYTMFNVQQRGVVTMNQLSEMMNLDTSTMTRVVGKLVRDGYLKREKSPEDGRVIQISLTDQGHQVVSELNQEVKEFYSYIISEIPQGEVINVLDSVNLLLKAFEKVKPFCC